MDERRAQELQNIRGLIGDYTLIKFGSIFLGCALLVAAPALPFLFDENTIGELESDGLGYFIYAPSVVAVFFAALIFWVGNKEGTQKLDEPFF